MSEIFQSTVWGSWQDKLLKYIEGEISDRKIRWYVDEEGGKGKIFSSKYLITRGMENAKSNDIRYAWAGQKVVIVDLSRSNDHHINYGMIESIKNGVVFSSKYERAMNVFQVPHVIVFSNMHPDEEKFSKDRWDIVDLSAEGT